MAAAINHHARLSVAIKSEPFLEPMSSRCSSDTPSTEGKCKQTALEATATTASHSGSPAVSKDNKLQQDSGFVKDTCHFYVQPESRQAKCSCCTSTTGHHSSRATSSSLPILNQGVMEHTNMGIASTIRAKLHEEARKAERERAISNASPMLTPIVTTDGSAGSLRKQSTSLNTTVAAVEKRRFEDYWKAAGATFDRFSHPQPLLATASISAQSSASDPASFYYPSISQRFYYQPISSSTSPPNILSPSNSASALFRLKSPSSSLFDKKIILYKTEMCRTLEETGTCRYALKCQFAHDASELRPVPRHPRYKTEICNTFWRDGTCPYGKRCCFIHTEEEARNSGVDIKKATAVFLAKNATREPMPIKKSPREQQPPLSDLDIRPETMSLESVPRYKRSVGSSLSALRRHPQHSMAQSRPAAADQLALLNARQQHIYPTPRHAFDLSDATTINTDEDELDGDEPFGIDDPLLPSDMLKQMDL